MESINSTKCLLSQTLNAYKNKKKALDIRSNSLNRTASSGLMQMLTEVQWMLDIEDKKAAEVIRSVSKYPLYSEIHYIVHYIHILYSSEEEG